MIAACLISNGFAMHTFLFKMWPRMLHILLKIAKTSQVNEHAEGYFHIDPQWSREQKIFP